MRKLIAGIICTLACCTTAQADDKDKGKTLYALTPIDADTPRWQQTDDALYSDEDYLRRVDNNRKIVRQELQVYADRLISSDDYSDRAIGLLGAAVVGSLTDTRVHLNDSRSLGMVFRDTAESDRSVMIQFRKTW
jgi:hypothetical protein